jgi:hypothetical protein
MAGSRRLLRLDEREPPTLLTSRPLGTTTKRLAIAPGGFDSLQLSRRWVRSYRARLARVSAEGARSLGRAGRGLRPLPTSGASERSGVMPRIHDEVVGQDESRRVKQRSRCPSLIQRARSPRPASASLASAKHLASHLGARRSGTDGLVRGYCRRRRSRMDRTRSRGSPAAGRVLRVRRLVVRHVVPGGTVARGEVAQQSWRCVEKADRSGGFHGYRFHPYHRAEAASG